MIFQPKMAAILFLGFSSGLPLFLSGKTLQSWMTVESIDLATIGLVSLVGLPYSLKFLWAPLLDRYVPPLLGRRRGWMLLTQVALLLSLAAMAFFDPQGHLQALAVCAVLVAFFSASQDIVFDAYRADVLEEHERGFGAGLGVLGYRIALIVTGAGALVMADSVGWPAVYGTMAGLMAIGMMATWIAPEPRQTATVPESLSAAVKQPFVEFLTRLGWKRAAAILAFIVIYKFSDTLAGSMVNPFLLKSGFSQTQVGAIQGGVGIVATIFGVLAGGMVLARIGVNRSLWVFGFLQAVSNLSYYLLSVWGPVDSSLGGLSSAALMGVVTIENFCAGLGTAAFVAFLMSLCNQRYSATQYALLSSLIAVSRDVLVAPAGKLAEMTGWPLFFLLTVAAALPGMFLLPFFAPYFAPNAAPNVAPDVAPTRQADKQSSDPAFSPEAFPRARGD